MPLKYIGSSLLLRVIRGPPLSPEHESFPIMYHENIMMAWVSIVINYIILLGMIIINLKHKYLPISPPAHKCRTEWMFLKNLKFDLHSSIGTLGTISFCMMFECAPIRLKSPRSLWSLLFLPHPATNSSQSLGNYFRCYEQKLIMKLKNCRL